MNGLSCGDKLETWRKCVAGGCSARHAESAVAAGAGGLSSFKGMKPLSTVVLLFICHEWYIGGVLVYTEDDLGDPYIEAGREGEIGGSCKER